MIQYQDEQSLLRILRVSQIPQDVVDEYELRIQMFHGDGHSGPLGTVGLIDIVRFLGHGRIVKTEMPSEVDWRTIPANGTVRVECRFFGDWQPGVFLGFVAVGTLAVRLDSDPIVRECTKHMVRLAPRSDSVSPLEDKPDARASLIKDDVPVAAEAVVDGSELPGVDCKEQDVVEKTEPSEDLESPPIPVVEKRAATMSLEAWEAVPVGTPVWVEVEGDMVDGTFVGLSGGGIEVLIDEGAAVTKVPATDVVKAG